MNKIVNINIKKLFNSKDVSLSFNNGLNIIIGPNGCGKSTIMKIINAIINNDYVLLSTIPFESIELIIGNKTSIINHKDLVNLELSLYPEFRFLIKETNINDFENFDVFYEYIVKKSKTFVKDNQFYSERNKYNENKEQFVEGDNKIFVISNYIKKMSFNKCVYGSKYYLMNLYYVLKGTPKKLFEIPGLNLSTYYSFIDLDENFYDYSRINIINRLLAKIQLQKFIRHKVKINKGIVEIYDGLNKINHENLSAGEKKIIQFYKAMYSSTSSDILFLDEPELSLSFKWKNDLMKKLKNKGKRTKIIIATQNPKIVDEKDLQLLVPMLED